jgi:GNAT superfamily N-acetyltransferase
MPDFSYWTDQQVISYLIEHYDEIEVGKPDPDLADRLLRGIGDGSLALEKGAEVFALVARANRQSRMFFVQIDPAADLMFLMVAAAATDRGIGSAFLEQVKHKYLEDQAMILVCNGDRRRSFFEKAGFVKHATTEEGLNFMICPPRVDANK